MVGLNFGYLARDWEEEPNRHTFICDIVFMRNMQGIPMPSTCQRIRGCCCVMRYCGSHAILIRFGATFTHSENRVRVVADSLNGGW